MSLLKVTQTSGNGCADLILIIGCKSVRMNRLVIYHQELSGRNQVRKGMHFTKCKSLIMNELSHLNVLQDKELKDNLFKRKEQLVLDNIVQ